MKVVKEEGGHAEYYEQHYDEVLDRCQREIELLEHLLEEPKYKSDMVVRSREMSQTLGETRPCENFQTNSVFSDIEDREKGQYNVTIKDSKYSLLLVNEMETQGQQPSIKEGYVFENIKDGEVEEGSSQQIEGA